MCNSYLASCLSLWQVNGETVCKISEHSHSRNSWIWWWELIYQKLSKYQVRLRENSHPGGGDSRRQKCGGSIGKEESWAGNKSAANPGHCFYMLGHGTCLSFWCPLVTTSVYTHPQRIYITQTPITHPHQADIRHMHTQFTELFWLFFH